MGGEKKPAIPSSEHPVPAWNTHRARDFAKRIHWDDLKAYLAVCESGGFRAAATATGIAVNTLRRKVERLEGQGKVTLLRRDINGVTPTESGEILLSVAREMQASVGRDPGEAGSDVLVCPGELRIGCTEALGSVWLTPRMMMLHDQIDGLTLSLQHSYDAGGDRSRDVDVGITFNEPQNPELIRARIGALHFMLFASQGYLNKYGQPKSFPDIRENHRFIEQSTAGVKSELVDFFFGTHRPNGFVPIRSNSAMSVFWAVVNGAGIGAFPTYTRALSKEMVPLQLPFQLRFDLWMYYHASAKNSPAVRAAVEWLKDAFDGTRYPWFADEFVHPDDFPGVGREGDVVRLFQELAPRVVMPGEIEQEAARRAGG